jgi:tRNA (guanine37-N1)-methyltransferase
MNFHVITLFPKSFDSYINESILSRAKEKKIIKFAFYNPRDFVKPTKSQNNNDKPYIRIDDKPYGGGPGMVVQAKPIVKALKKVIKKMKSKPLIIYLSPGAKKFTNNEATKISKKYKEVIIVCGRYEGIDARVKKIYKGIEYSIGDYVLTGGELPAMVIIDTVSRHIAGVLGNDLSIEENRIASSDVYTRPEILEFNGRKYKVPKILLSGDHKKIEEWKKVTKLKI